MGISLVVAVTDSDWFNLLRRQPLLTEVNFWAPSDKNFRALQPGELFLFKLHAPINKIVGGGIFAYATSLPLSLAWESFTIANGANTLTEMRRRIAGYRRAGADDRSDFPIGCRILTQPFFFDEHDWLPMPQSWSDSIVSLKTFTTGTEEGLGLWEAVTMRLAAAAPLAAEPGQRFGAPTLIRPRLGQGGFRIVVTDEYQRRCAITGEKTLPALDAAHIQPYGEGGGHAPSNGILLRRDIHSLFDAGYVTITPNLRFEVSSKIREEFENGRHYYALHGQPISVPRTITHHPDVTALRWHNESVYKG
ncbi:MAG: restriction endonuclease [Bryobacterales bacterium]|nr:restriction endonuclease [Bryobacterales bacterium]